MLERTLPLDPELREAWEGYANGELRLTKCGECGRLRWPARTICNACGSDHGEQILASGRATVASWTVTHHQFSPHVPVPYAVVLGRLAEQDDILVPGDHAGAPDGSDLVMGQRIEAEFVPVADGELRGGIIRWRAER